ncbi:hypothetical protein BCR33DRAFT_854694 [Rhizoclosmatium globosum]|uniref:Uncharacterized protein n=1 Tax=Rhizoclosmatium globosum TaxID=329046 RepID=A0A1Y2BRZ7_9FUNG|nr:hypothetical protein BCR33DRAFT_854694 [Rhizoclosmatium globosum]|eukprot:ORY37397.1 hypothetical protein BCR33DRAFT_854694 [Rhizoclosmatium globosum]
MTSLSDIEDHRRKLKVVQGRAVFIKYQKKCVKALINRSLNILPGHHLVDATDSDSSVHSPLIKPPILQISAVDQSCQHQSSVKRWDSGKLVEENSGFVCEVVKDIGSTNTVPLPVAREIIDTDNQCILNPPPRSETPFAGFASARGKKESPMKETFSLLKQKYRGFELQLVDGMHKSLPVQRKENDNK